MKETGAVLGGPEGRAKAPRPRSAFGLVGDIGGTNARFALVEPAGGEPRIAEYQSFVCRDFATVTDVICAYLETVALKNAPPPRTVIAVAGPVSRGSIALTNLGWSFSEDDLRKAGLGDVRLINDYAALASGAPHYRPSHLRHIGGPIWRPEQGETLAVVGAGTGFGVAALAQGLSSEVVLATEGGHVGFAPVDALEVELLGILSARFGRVSIERILSGPGLSNLHAALCQIHGEAIPAADPAAITLAAQAGDPASVRSIERFCAILGSAAGDIALAFGARGGVYIGGGIAPVIGDQLLESRFRERFEAKGRFEGYMRAIPTWIINHPHAALMAAARVLTKL